MAKLGTAFDSGQHEDMRSGFDPIPAGKYLSMLVESEIRQTAKKDGKYAKLKFKVLEGEFKGRFVWTNLNLVNPSPIAVEIAQKELATLCRACGKAVIQDTAELHGIPIKMKVKIKPAKDDYPAGNEPVGYEPATASAMATNPASAENKDTEAEVPWGNEGGEEEEKKDDDIPF